MSTPKTDHYRVYSDGALPGPPAAKGDSRIGAGGWGVLVIAPDGSEVEAFGGHPATTVPRMEMTAALEGLKRTPAGATVVVTSDSKLLIQGLTEWVPGWIRKGWRASTGAPVKNRDLWEALLFAAALRDVTWAHIYGHQVGRPGAHAGHALNERADRLAARGVPTGGAGNGLPPVDGQRGTR